MIFTIAKVIDATGVLGSLIHNVFAAFCFLSSLLIFIYLWYKGKLDMDEGPAQEMLKIDENNGKKYD